MGKWDKDERRWDNEGRRGRRSQNDDDDDEQAIKIHEVDLYDQELLELKRLVNERDKAPANCKEAYNIAIRNTINKLEEEYVGQAIYPHAAFKKDIESALQGGKYRKYYQDPTNDNIIDIDRKKRTNKPKPKRKPVKKVVKKKVIKKKGVLK